MAEKEYWYESEVKKFNFDTDENNQTQQDFCQLGVQLRAGLKDGTAEENKINIETRKQILLPLQSIISAKALENILIAQSGTAPKGEGHSAVTNDFYPNVSITLKRLIIGRPCSLSHHRSLAAKKQFLDGAIAIGDGNAILAVVLFLGQTLKKKLFYQILSSRPVAVSHYVNYLMIRLKTHELVDLFVMLGQSRDAALKQYQIIMNSMVSSSDVLSSKLKNILSNHFTQPNVETMYINFVNNYIKLLEWQKSLNVSDLNNKSLMQCLAYCYMNHWQEANGKPNSPQTLCQQHQISPQQYEWISLCVFSKLKNWDVIETMFVKKNFFGRNKLSFSIPLPKVIGLLKESNANSIVLDKYLNLISSVDQRLELAKKYKVHRTVIDCLMLKKDRHELTLYKMTLNPQSEEYIHAENALKTVGYSSK